MPRTLRDNIRIRLYEKIMRDMHQKYPDAPYNRGLAFVFYTLLKEGIDRFQKSPTTDNVQASLIDKFTFIAPYIDLSEWFFDEKNQPALKVAIRMVIRNTIYAQQNYQRSHFLPIVHVNQVLHDFSLWRTGECIDYAAISMYELLTFSSISSQSVDFVWLSHEPYDLNKKESVGHAVIIISQESVDYTENRYLLSEEAVVFDFWQGRVCLISEYDFSLYPHARLKYRTKNLGNPLNFQNNTEDFKKTSESFDKAVNNFLTAINERRRNNEHIIPATADYCAQFQALANSYYAEFDPNDLLDEKRVNATIDSPNIAKDINASLVEAANIFGQFATEAPSGKGAKEDLNNQGPK